jgi:hypothetical protein
MWPRNKQVGEGDVKRRATVTAGRKDVQALAIGHKAQFINDAPLKMPNAIILPARPVTASLSREQNLIMGAE